MNILIIKFSALGDVLRTTTLLSGLRRKYPGAHITWITEPVSIDLFKGNSLVDRVIAYTENNKGLLKNERFDLLISLDKEDNPTYLAEDIIADKKIGFGRGADAKLKYFNKESGYAYRLGISDELKFKVNKKTYPEIIYEMCSLGYCRDKYVFELSDIEKSTARNSLAGFGISERDKIVGINIGAGGRFANKMLPFEKERELISELLKDKGMKVILLGGTKEKLSGERLKALFKERVYDLTGKTSIREFAGIIKHCGLVIAGDTFGMHMAIALGIYVVVVFGPTSSSEIELYGNGNKIVSDIECSPCYKNKCLKKRNCMSLISLSQISALVKKRLQCKYE